MLLAKGPTATTRTQHDPNLIVGVILRGGILTVDHRRVGVILFLGTLTVDHHRAGVIRFRGTLIAPGLIPLVGQLIPILQRATTPPSAPICRNAPPMLP